MKRAKTNDNFIGTISRFTISNSLVSLCIAMHNRKRVYFFQGITLCQEYSKYVTTRMSLRLGWEKRGRVRRPPSHSIWHKPLTVCSETKLLAKFSSSTRASAFVTPFSEPSWNSEGEKKVTFKCATPRSGVLKHSWPFAKKSAQKELSRKDSTNRRRSRILRRWPDWQWDLTRE